MHHYYNTNNVDAWLPEARRESNNYDRHWSRGKTLSGPTIHQLTQTDISDKVLFFEYICTETQKNNLLALHTSSYMTVYFSDGTNLYTGSIDVNERRISKDYWLCTVEYRIATQEI